MPLAPNQVLKFTGTNWTNSNVFITELNDVNITTPAVNDVVLYNGSNWINSNSINTSLNNKVDKTTTVNGLPLSSNVTLTKTDIGLGNVDNTSDVNKPVSTATQTALNLKVDKTTTVNSKALSSNITLLPTDLGALSTPTANTLVLWDSNLNLRANDYIKNVTTTPSSVTTLALTATSSQVQVITGTVAQTIILPNATTLLIGHEYDIDNNSTQLISVNYQDNVTLLTTIPTGLSKTLTLINNSTSNGIWYFPTSTANKVVMTDSQGNILGNTDTIMTSGTVTFSNSLFNQNYIFNVGGNLQSNNTANNNVTVFNIRTPGEARGATFQMNSGTSCQIISEYNNGAIVLNYAMYRNNVKILSFYSATQLTCNVDFITPSVTVSNYLITIPIIFTATGTITSTISICNSSTALTLTLPSSPSDGQNIAITNINTGIVTIASVNILLGLNDSITLVYSTTNSWTVTNSNFIANRSNNFTAVTTSTTILYPYTTVNSSSPTTQTLPAANSVPIGKNYKINNINTGVVTVNVPGVTNFTLNTNQTLTATSTGSSWFVG